MTRQHARNYSRLYRYDVSMVIERGENDGLRRVPAGPVDQAVIEQMDVGVPVTYKRWCSALYLAWLAR